MPLLCLLGTLATSPHSAVPQQPNQEALSQLPGWRPCTGQDVELGGPGFVMYRGSLEDRAPATAHSHDFSVFFLVQASDTARHLLGFYYGNYPSFPTDSSTRFRVGGISGLNYARADSTGRGFRDVLLEVGGTPLESGTEQRRPGIQRRPFGRPSFVHIWYRGLSPAEKALADRLIATIRRCP